MRTLIIDNKEISYYKVDTNGDIWNAKGLKMKKHKTDDGYSRVKLSVGCKRGMYRVCRLVAMTYLDNTNNFPIVHHKNEVRDDDRPCNLEWTDNSNNQLERFKTKPGTKLRPVWQLDLVTKKRIRRFDSAIYAENKLGISRQNIYHVCRGNRVNAGGYSWEYDEPSVETIETVARNSENGVE